MNGSSDSKTVSLVLGAGGARGLAHIGVIRELESRGLAIHCIAGSSMGALVGGIYAAGKLDVYEDWVKTLDQGDVIKLLDWNFSGGGIVKGNALIDKLNRMLGEHEIGELDIAFTAVAVDLDRGREVWIDRGRLFDAIRASIAIPGIFTPHRYMGRNLVDGGLLNPVPLTPTLRFMSDLTIAVDVNVVHNHFVDSPEPASPEDDEEGDGESFMDYFTGLLGRQRSAQEEAKGIVDIMSRSLSIVESALTRHYVSVYEPDVLVRIPHDSFRFYEFHRAADLIALGREKTRETLDDLGL